MATAPTKARTVEVHSDRAPSDAPPAKCAGATPTCVEAERAGSMSAHPSLWNRQLVERVESLHRKVLGGPSSDLAPSKPIPDDGVTLALHGDLDSDSAPYLQGVLDALVLLQPVHLSVDLSQVRRVSRESLRKIARSGDAIGSWSLLDPSPSACADLIGLGRSDLVETESAQSATA